MVKQMGEKLALHGGSPVRETLLPYGRQFVDDEDIELLVKTLRSPLLTQGPKIKEFEEAVANYVGSKYAVAFSNGTAALHAACYATGIGEGDEVITTPLTFAASANCVRYCGGTVVFADVDKKTYNIQIDQVKQKVTPKTKAIIPVDFTGQPVDLDEIMDFAKERGIIVIEDAAHALGATYKDKKIGSIADMSMFSFHPVKHITTGEGGIITTNSEEFYKRMLVFRTHGITRDKELLQNNVDGPWYYEMADLGYNYRMTDIQAALGLSQMKKLETFITRRREIATRYTEEFAKNEAIVVPYQRESRESSWHLYVIQLKLNRLNAGRKEIFEALVNENIGVNVHYIPVHYHPYYRQLGYKRGIAPVAEHVYESFLTLPLFPGMTDKDVKDVIDAVHKVINYYIL